MIILPPSGNHRPSNNQPSHHDDFDAAEYMSNRFERMFGAHNYPPEMQARMAQQEVELQQRLDNEAQELLDSVAHLSVVPEEEKALLASSAPEVVSLNAGKRTLAPHVFWIKRILSNVDDGYHQADWVSEESLVAFLNDLTDTQFARVTGIMNQYPTLHVHAQVYIRECFKTFASDDEEDVENVYNLLILGEAIYERLVTVTETFRLEHFVREGQQIARGITFDHGGDIEDPKEYEKKAALYKFAFCLQVLDKHPVFGMRYVRPTPRFETDWDSYHYEDTQLVNVLREHADKVDQLIDFSETYHDIDPAKLRAVAEGTPLPQTRSRI